MNAHETLKLKVSALLTKSHLSFRSSPEQIQHELVTVFGTYAEAASIEGVLLEKSSFLFHVYNICTTRVYANLWK